MNAENPTTPEVALGSAINRVVNGRCENSETGRHSAVCGHPAFITDIGMPAAILAALDGWTLVRRDDLRRWNVSHGNTCYATTLGPDARCTCGLSAALAVVLVIVEKP